MPRRGRKPKKTEAPAPAEEGGADGASSPESEVQQAATPQAEEGASGEGVDAPDSTDQADQTRAAESGVAEGGGVAAETEEPAAPQNGHADPAAVSRLEDLAARDPAPAEGAHLPNGTELAISLTKDGDQWCALVGPNMQDGIVAFAPSPWQAIERLTTEAAGRDLLQYRAPRSPNVAERDRGKDYVRFRAVFKSPGVTTDAEGSDQFKASLTASQSQVHDLHDLHKQVHRFANAAVDVVLLREAAGGAQGRPDQLQLLPDTGTGRTEETAADPNAARCALSGACPIEELLLAGNDFATSVLDFANAMACELAAHAEDGEPGTWVDYDPGMLMTRLHQQQAKLDAAVTARDLAAVIKHAAHVGNLAMMAVDIVRHRQAPEAEAEPEPESPLPDGMDAYVCTGPEPCCILDQLPEDGNCPECGKPMQPFRYDLECDKCGTLFLTWWDQAEAGDQHSDCSDEDEPGTLVGRPPAAPEPAANEEAEETSEEADASE